jgi:hypothetical protein
MAMKLSCMSMYRELIGGKILRPCWRPLRPSKSRRIGNDAYDERKKDILRLK